MSEKDKILTLYLTGPKKGMTGVLGRGLAAATNGVIKVNATHVNLISMLKKFYAASEIKPKTELSPETKK